MRSGPGAEFPAVGTAPVGQLLDIVGRTENGAWYQLADGNWIARFMVDNAPLTIPVTTPACAPSTGRVQWTYRNPTTSQRLDDACRSPHCSAPSLVT
ncbi:MAG: SH3 domain-containing protein [Caldilineaceae bacterium]